jgi:hypothetical protein
MGVKLHSVQKMIIEGLHTTGVFKFSPYKNTYEAVKESESARIHFAYDVTDVVLFQITA